MKVIYEKADIQELLDSELEESIVYFDTQKCFFDKERVKVKKSELEFAAELVSELTKELSILKSYIRSLESKETDTKKTCVTDMLIADARKELESEAKEREQSEYAELKKKLLEAIDEEKEP